MIFTNVTCAGIYMQCCHREVAPGESFVAPWLEVRENRAVRLAMADGALAWESEDGEPFIEGSAKLPSAAEREKAKRRRDDDRKARKAEEASELRDRRRRDDEAVKANMARMGSFNVPKLSPRLAPRKRVSYEKPITREDVISDGKPKSLSDIMRHNRAVKRFGGGEGAAEGKAPSGVPEAEGKEG